jgi:hypothetical protein
LTLQLGDDRLFTAFDDLANVAHDVFVDIHPRSSLDCNHKFATATSVAKPGHFAQNPRAGDFECNRDVSPTASWHYDVFLMGWWKFWLASRRAKAGIEVIARRYCATAKAFRWGGSRVGQPSFCVEVATDQQRDRVVQESSLYQQFRDALYAAGYPSSVVPQIHFRVESRETLDRKYGGSWSEAMEMP